MFGEIMSSTSWEMKDRVFYESPIPLLEEYILHFNLLNFGVGHTNSAFICEKIDKIKKTNLGRR